MKEWIARPTTNHSGKSDLDDDDVDDAAQLYCEGEVLDVTKPPEMKALQVNDKKAIYGSKTQEGPTSPTLNGPVQTDTPIFQKTTSDEVSELCVELFGC